MENESEVVLAELQGEIMLRLPLKNLARIRCVCKEWASMISDKHFRDSYLKRLSETRPRVLFAFIRGIYEYDTLYTTPEVLLHSVYQQEKPLLSCGQQQMRISPEHGHLLSGYLVAGSVRGLVCVQSPNEAVICNLSTKKIVTLPQLEDHDEVCFNRSFIGYDKTNKVVKVLCTTDVVIGQASNSVKDYRVYTVGSGEVSWRKIEYEHKHTIATKGICKEGVLYYGAWDKDGTSIVMTFHMSYEEFGVIQLREGFQLHNRDTLVNYKKEIAIVKGAVNNTNGEIHLLVRNNNGGGWRDEYIVIPRWRDNVGDMIFYLKGAINGTRELVFSQNRLYKGPHYVVYYNTVTENLELVRVEAGVNEDQFPLVDTFLDHVDSLWLD